jgi:molybdate transport system substrate-binding protein
MLQKQIEAGAPTDVFASASPKEMDALKASGMLLAGSRSDFAGNTIVLIAALNSSVRLTTFDDLKKSDVKRIALGNPATVPAGMYAEETLKTLGLRDKLGEKLIFGEHVRQVMDYVARKEVEAGMVFLTDALSRSKELKIVAEAPPSSHKPVVYIIAAIRGTKNETAARGFIELVLSPEGKEVLRKYGFRPIP